MSMTELAKAYAQAAHRAVGQKRKYTGECYTVHTCEVAQMVQNYGGSEDMICAAHLHDVIEDTDKTYEDIYDAGFMYEISEYVLGMTDVSVPSDGNRAARKALDREHLAAQGSQVQTIKLADLIDNSKTILAYGGKFAPVYIEEKKLLLKVLTKGDESLQKMASDIVKSYDRNR